MPSGHPCILTIAGERRSVAEWAIIAGIPKVTILARLRRGISASLAVVRSQWGSCLSITWKAA